MELLILYKVKDVVYLSEEENKELLANELYLTKVYHVDTEEEVPLEEYPVKYTIGIDIDVF